MGTKTQSKIQPWSESLGHLLLWSMMDLLGWIVQKPGQAGLRQGPIKVPDVLVSQTAIGFPASVFPKVSRVGSLEDPQEVFKNVVGQHGALLSSC